MWCTWAGLRLTGACLCPSRFSSVWPPTQSVGVNSVHNTPSYPHFWEFLLSIGEIRTPNAGNTISSQIGALQTQTKGWQKRQQSKSHLSGSLPSFYNCPGALGLGHVIFNYIHHHPLLCDQWKCLRDFWRGFQNAKCYLHHTLFEERSKLLFSSVFRKKDGSWSFPCCAAYTARGETKGL